jgi:exopolysaccharide biosynthesis polyprenyl glycosylphosphotransferase
VSEQALDLELAEDALESGESIRAERLRTGFVASHPHWREPLLRRMLAGADLAAVGVTMVLLRFAGGGAIGAKHFYAALALLPAWLVLAKVHGLYDRDRRDLRHLSVDELPSIFAWSMSGTVLTALVLMVFPVRGLGVTTVVLAWLGAATAAFLFRSCARFLWRRITPPERVFLLGEGPLAQAVRRKLELFPDMHARVVAERPLDGIDIEGEDWLVAGADRIILASSSLDEDLMASLLEICRQERLKLTVVPPVRGMFGTAVQLNRIADLPVVEYGTGEISRSTLFLKRALDIVGSVLGLVLLAPVFAALALAIRLDSRGPAIFRQTRSGLGGRTFRMFKFRTMRPDAEDLLADLVPFERLREPMFKLRHDPRVTRVGRFLRRTSLDELPQLFNVLKGEMSLVGPRPEQVELVELYSEEQRFRLAVQPGLTGPMQVYGRGELTFDERLAVERDYIENLSVGRDLRIVALTLAPLISGKGAF